MPATPRLNRPLATAAFVLVCGAAVLAWSRIPVERPADQDSDPVVFSMSLQDSSGDVVARPVVMGEPGQKVQVRMVCEADPQQEKMHLTLDPMGMEGGQLLYSYELSVPGQVDDERGTVKLSMGRVRKLHIKSMDSRGVVLSFYTETLKQYMKRHKPHARVAS